MSNFRGGSGPRKRRGFQPEKEDTHRINKKIRAPKVRVITDDGEQLGILIIAQAITVAEEKGLDLVEVSPNTDPPVCKLMDYGKFKYREQKRETEAKKKRTETETKELRIRYRTDVGDLDTKLKKARGFLLSGDKVKFSMRFKGREVMYTDLGVKKFNEIVENLADVSTIDERSPERGRQIYIVLAPQKQAVQKQAAAGSSKEEAKKEEAPKTEESKAKTKEAKESTNAPE